MTYSKYDGQFFKAYVGEPIYGGIEALSYSTLRLSFVANGQEVYITCSTVNLCRLIERNRWLYFVMRSKIDGSAIDTIVLSNMKLITNLYDRS